MNAFIFAVGGFASAYYWSSTENNNNNEMTLIVDVDLELLKELNMFGSVRNLSDRRTDIYTLAKRVN